MALQDRIVPRAAWTRVKPRSVDRTFTKDGGVVVHYSTRNAATLKRHWPDCYNSWAAHQSFHMNQKNADGSWKYSDLAYNFGMCPHGFIFEGRGWNAQNGANTPINTRTLSICVDFDSDDQPIEAVIYGLNQFIAHAIEVEGWAPIVRGHGQASGTGTPCPGPILQALIDNGTIGFTEKPNVPSPVPAPQPPTDSVTLTQLLGLPSVTVPQMQAWARKRGATARFVQLAPFFYAESTHLGVDPAAPYAISFHETGGGKFGGVVTPDMNNWGGLKRPGTWSDTDTSGHATFPDDRVGVLAVVQHVANYAGVDVHPLVLVDPRWSQAIFGKAPALPSAGWLWSSSPAAHAATVVKLMKEMAAA